MDYAGNSNKAKEEAAKEAEPKRVIEAVAIEGEVVQKEPGFGHKVKHIFFGGDVKDVAQFVFYEKALPGLRDMLFSMGSDGWHRMLYGTGGKRGGNPQAGHKVKYNSSPIQRAYDPRVSPAPTSPTSRSAYPSARPRQHQMQDIVFSSHDDAQRILDTLVACVEQYQVVSLADLKESVKLPSAHIDQKWGWTNLASSDIRQVREGFLLELPQMEEIQ